MKIYLSSGGKGAISRASAISRIAIAVILSVALIFGVMPAAMQSGPAGDDSASVYAASSSENLKSGDDSSVAPLVKQDLEYTENPVDIPNPDRGFYVTDEYIVPVTGDNPTVPGLNTTIVGTTVPVKSRIVYMEFNLKNFSSNAPLNRRPMGPYPNATAEPNYGTTQPLTDDALNYVRTALQQIRASEAVAIVKFNYDGQGYTYVDSGAWDTVIHDCEPGAPQGKAWYADLYNAWGLSGKSGAEAFEEFISDFREEEPAKYTEPGATSDSCGIPGHEDKNWVQYHLWQLGDVFTEFEDCIMAVKGGIFGPWGEMHSSSYARTAEGYHWLLQALLDYVPASRSILVHAGGVMAWHNEEYGTDYSFTNPMPAPARGTPAQRFGMFNDSYSRGLDGDYYNDNGSLSEGYALIGSGDEDDFDRNVVLTWMRNQNNFYGGETVGPGGASNLYPRFPNVPYEAAYAQTTHLNSEYNSNTYTLWGNFVYNKANVTTKFTPPHDGVDRTAIYDSVYNGRNGMEYMRDRLGYRLVLRDANASEWVVENGTLKFEGKIQNVGFGNVVNRKNITVILKAKNGTNTYKALTSLDARDWKPDIDSRASNKAAWRDLKFSIDLSAFGNVPIGDYDIYLKINDPKETSTGRRCIQFANHDIWNASLSANLIGSTTVTPIILISSVSLSASAKTIKEGETFTLTPAVSPSDATDKSVTWATSAPTIATVTQDGVVKGINEGKATITVTANDDSGQKASCVVTVTAEKVTNPVPPVDKPTVDKPAVKKPAKVSNIKYTSGKQKITVKWKKVSNATGYQVKYSTSKKFKKGKVTKTITIKKKATVKKVIKKLKAKKTYYLKVRAFNKDNAGKNQYGPWSKVKRIKTK